MPDEGTAEEQSKETQEAPPKQFSQDDVNRLIARERRKFEDELKARPSAEQLQELQAKLDSIQEEREMAGKSEREKAEHKHQQELAKLNQKIQQLSEEAKQKEQAVAEAQKTLQTERMNRAFGAALQEAGVYAGASSDALRVLIAELKDPEIDPDSGAVTAGYGDLIADDPKVIAKKFLEDKPYFATAKSGGAGTKQPNTQARTTRSIAEMSADELAEAAGQAPAA